MSNTTQPPKIPYIKQFIGDDTLYTRKLYSQPNDPKNNIQFKIMLTVNTLRIT